MREPRVKVLFIASPGRSGSTILDRLLSARQGFWSTGELMQIWDRGFRANLRCGCGEPLRQCEFWAAVAAQVSERPDAAPLEAFLELHRYHCRKSTLPARAVKRLTGSRRYGEQWRTYSTALGALYRSVQRVSGCRVVVDSSKSFTYALTLARLPEIDLRVVHLVRDSRAVAYSWQRKKRDPSFGGEERFLSRFSPTRISLSWDLANTALDLLGATEALACLRVRYEDLIERPGAELNRILGHLDEEPLDPSEMALRTLPPGVAHTVSGNPMRFEKGNIELRLDVEWQRKMLRRQRLLVSALTWPLLLRYGYLGAPAREDR